jgi:thiol-disulfide isomerase/thioredoxin
MSGLFKRSFLPVALFAIGAILIYLWFQNTRKEGFDVYSITAPPQINAVDPYAPKITITESSLSNSPDFNIKKMPSSTSALTQPAVCDKIYYFDMYYVEWCSFCERALPEFLALGPKLTIGDKTILCTAYEYEKYQKEHDKSDIFGQSGPIRLKADEKWQNFRGKDPQNPILGYPTLRLYDASQRVIADYKGQRQRGVMKQWLTDILNRNAFEASEMKSTSPDPAVIYNLDDGPALQIGQYYGRS